MYLKNVKFTQQIIHNRLWFYQENNIWIKLLYLNNNKQLYTEIFTIIIVIIFIYNIKHKDRNTKIEEISGLLLI